MAPQNTPVDRLAKLIAKALSDMWAGPDVGADPVRQACIDVFSAMFLRADSVTNGATSKHFARLLQEYLKRNPAPNADKSGQTSPEEIAAREMAKTLLKLLPADFQSLAAMLAAFHTEQRTRSSDAAPAPEPAAGGDAFKSSDVRDLFLSGGELGALWPSKKRLAEKLLKILGSLRGKYPCVEAFGDIGFWGEQVCWQAASSFGVAAAIKTAFKGLNLAGVSKSNTALGNQVHAHVENVAAAALAPQLDRYLVAEHRAHLPGGILMNLDAQAKINKGLGEHSLACLVTARTQMDDVIRSAKSKGVDSASSREDLVMFYSKTPTTLIPTLLRDGCPELYEVKPVDGLVQAVSQVTSYSLNYLSASVAFRCLGPKPANARLENTLMLPASPEHPSLPIPSISITNVLTLTNLSVATPIAAAKLAQIVAEFTAAMIKSPPQIAIPFMISGLYGVIPYFVLDMGPNVQAVLQAVIQTLITAIIAYLSARKAFEEILGEVATALGAFLKWVAKFAIAVALLFVIISLLIGTAPGAAIAVTAGLIILVSAAVSNKSKDPETIDAETTPMTMYYGPLVVQGITATQLAQFARKLSEAVPRLFKGNSLANTGGLPSV